MSILYTSVVVYCKQIIPENVENTRKDNKKTGRLRPVLLSYLMVLIAHSIVGFDGMVDGVVGSLYKWEDLKDGVQAYWDRQSAKTAASMGLLLKHYKQLNAAGSTEPDKIYIGSARITRLAKRIVDAYRSAE